MCNGVIACSISRIAISISSGLRILSTCDISAKNLREICAKAGFFSYAALMAIDNILAQIDSEIERLTKVRALLANVGSTAAIGNKAKKSASNSRKKRILSPEARKRIADAQRKRWAAQRAKAKSTKSK